MPYPQQIYNYYSISNLGLQFILSHLHSHAATEIYLFLDTHFFTPHNRLSSARSPTCVTSLNN